MEGDGGTSRGSVQCHVPGCEAFIPNDKAFAKRCRVCPYHMGVPSADFFGQVMRFCHLCKKFENLEEFDGDRKSCREALDKHNARRRKRRSEAAAIGDTAAPAGQGRGRGRRGRPARSAAHAAAQRGYRIPEEEEEEEEGEPEWESTPERRQPAAVRRKIAGRTLSNDTGSTDSAGRQTSWQGTLPERQPSLSSWMEVAPGAAAQGMGAAARWVDAGVVSGAQALLDELAAAAHCQPASAAPGWRSAAVAPADRPAPVPRPPGPAAPRFGGAEGAAAPARAAGAAPPHPLSPREQLPAAPGELPASLASMDRAALKSIGDELAQLRSGDLRELSMGLNSLKLVGELPLGSMDMRELLAWLPAFLGDDPPPLESLPPEFWEQHKHEFDLLARSLEISAQLSRPHVQHQQHPLHSLGQLHRMQQQGQLAAQPPGQPPGQQGPLGAAGGRWAAVAGLHQEYSPGDGRGPPGQAGMSSQHSAALLLALAAQLGQQQEQAGQPPPQQEQQGGERQQARPPPLPPQGQQQQLEMELAAMSQEPGKLHSALASLLVGQSLPLEGYPSERSLSFLSAFAECLDEAAAGQQPSVQFPPATDQPQPPSEQQQAQALAAATAAAAAAAAPSAFAPLPWAAGPEPAPQQAQQLKQESAAVAPAVEPPPAVLEAAQKLAQELWKAGMLPAPMEQQPAADAPQRRQQQGPGQEPGQVQQGRQHQPPPALTDWQQGQLLEQLMQLQQQQQQQPPPPQAQEGGVPGGSAAQPAAYAGFAAGQGQGQGQCSFRGVRLQRDNKHQRDRSLPGGGTEPSPLLEFIR